MRVARGILFGLAASLAACYDFHLTGPEDPAEVNPPRMVSVTIEYRQPNGCENATGRCTDPVVFFGSWMRPGQEFALQDSGGFVWKGTARNVPVNFPPRDYAHAVRVYDPHLFDTPTGGVTAGNLRVGGQLITRFDSPGTDRESGIVYVDENGFGRSPF